MTRTQQFIKTQWARLQYPQEYFNLDSVQHRPEKWETAKMRFLLVFPTPNITKTVSTTASCILDMFNTHLPDVFFDTAYCPPLKDLQLYDELKLPYIISDIMHLDPSHYDIVGFSISVLHEIFTVPVLMNNLKYADIPIPLTWTERKNKKLQTHPIFITGGITASCAESLFGHLGDDRQAYLDGMVLGVDETLKTLCVQYMKVRDTTPDVTIQDCIDTFFQYDYFYQPQAYKVVYKDNIIIENTKINPKAQDEVIPYYPKKFNKDRAYNALTIVQGSGENAGDSQIQISEGCSSGNTCSFCYEGVYSGGWVESNLNTIKKDAYVSKRLSAATHCKPYSFNTNFYSDFSNLMYTLKQEFPKVSFLNQRLQEIGKDTEFIDMMKYTGFSKVQLPIEGISDEIRNGILNKRLDEEVIERVFNYLVGQNMSDIKIGAIYTGYETQEDWDKFFDFIKRHKHRANSFDKNFRVRIKFTSLVHYPNTPLYWAERKVGRIAFRGEKVLNERQIEQRNELNIYIKVLDFVGSNFVMQALLDLGQSLTQWIQNNVVKSNILFYNLNPFQKAEMMQSLRDVITNEELFFAEKDIDATISPQHRITLPLLGSVVNQARELHRHKTKKPQMESCLKTYDGCKVVCNRTALTKRPYLRYGDCKIMNGHITGKLLYELKGCNSCESTDEIKSHLKRKIDKTYNISDLMKIRNTEGKERKYRFVINRNYDTRALNPKNSVFTNMAKLLQTDDILLKNYWEIQYNTAMSQTDANLPYAAHGMLLYDAIFKDDVLEKIKENINKANDDLRTTRIVSVFEIPKEEYLKVSDMNVFRLQTTNSAEELINASNRYKQQVYYLDGLDVVLRKDENLHAPVIATNKYTIGYFALPVKYNPYLYIRALLKERRLKTYQLKQDFELQCKMVIRKTEHSFCSCGKNATFALNQNKLLKFCPECLSKVLLRYELSK